MTEQAAHSERALDTIAAAKVSVPSFAELVELRKSGLPLGYRGIHIYLRYAAVLEVLAQLPPIATVLNVGCGFGVFDRLLPASWQLTGVDVSEHEIAVAREWAGVHRPHWRYVVGAVESVPLAPHSFDLIVLSEVIEHIPSEALPAIFATTHKLLKPSGRLLVSVPNKWTWRNRCRSLFGMPLAVMDKTHLREYSLAEARGEMSRFPFTTEVFKAAVAYFPLESYVRRLVPEQSGIRRWLVSLFPGTASHFIFLLSPRQGSEG